MSIEASEGTKPESEPLPPDPNDSQDFVWCLVANVTREPHPEGVDGEMRLGTTHFAPGAKLYVCQPMWGDGGANLRVLGHHRDGGPRLTKIVVSSKWLVNWRAQKVFDPHVVKTMDYYGSWGNTEEARKEVEEHAAAWNARGGAQEDQREESTP